MTKTKQTNDERFLDAVAADLETLIGQGAKQSDCIILVDRTGCFQVLCIPNITVEEKVIRLAGVPFLCTSSKFLEGHSGIISLSLSSI